MSETCKKCFLWEHSKHQFLKGSGDLGLAKLAIFVDQPNFMDDKRGRYFVSEGADLLRYLLARMGLKPTDYYLAYTLCCCAGKKLPGKKAERLAVVQSCTEYRLATLQNMPNLKAIVALGAVSSEAFTHRTAIGETEGCDWFAMENGVRELGVENIWVAYSMAYLFEKPSETPSVYRVLWKAAEQAGLNPTETKLQPYNWNI